jgi:hypothetical protein
MTGFLTFRKDDLFSAFGVPSLILLAAVLYNAGLAFLNAHGVSVGQTDVALVEIAIVFCAALYVVYRMNSLKGLALPLVFSGLAFSLFAYVSIVNEQIFIKSLRDVMLILIFFLLGGLVKEKALLTAMRAITFLVMFFLAIEVWFLETYVSLFQPAKYYFNTRGIEELSVDETGLFRNALGFEERLSFSFFTDHRVSSLFLEQVSLANFCILLAIFVCAFWNKIGGLERLIYILCIAIMLVGNSSRTAAFMCAILPIGYFIFPYLPRFFTLLYLPLMIVVAFIFFYDPHFPGMTDDLKGRIGMTVHMLATMDYSYLTGGNLAQITKTADSGLAYLLFTQTIIGVLALWLFVGLVVPPVKRSYKRFSHGINLFIWVNLLTSAAIFSIKISAPLWFIAGYLHYAYKRERAEERFEWEQESAISSPSPAR